MKPGAGKSRLRPNLVRTTAEARENLAAELYNLQAVRATMASAAAEGFTFAIIAAPRMVDLRGTAAAVAAVEWLRAEGFTAEWSTRRAAEPRGQDEAAQDLVAGWGGASSAA